MNSIIIIFSRLNKIRPSIRYYHKNVLEHYENPRNVGSFAKNNKNELHTPIPDSFLDGITRRSVISIAKNKGIKVIERKILPDEMKDFEGCFLTGTAAEITPVSQIDKYNFEVCELIKDLNDSYQVLVRKKTAA